MYYGATQVTVVDGMQLLQITLGGTYQIDAFGASGGNSQNGYVGGDGIGLRGFFQFEEGDMLMVGIGQTGESACSGGGGGSSGVRLFSGEVLIVAGGGGGAGLNGIEWSASTNATFQENGQTVLDCQNQVVASGGTNGGGGQNGVPLYGDWPSGAGGAGVYENGMDGIYSYGAVAGGGSTQGIGGEASTNGCGSEGGFGFTGGGGAEYGGGGGGGYSGGGGGASITGCSSDWYINGGGGGSFCLNPESSYQIGFNQGHGKVFVTRIFD